MGFRQTPRSYWLEWKNLWASCPGSALTSCVCVTRSSHEDTLSTLVCRTLKPHWAQHLAALHVAQHWVFRTLTPREWGEGVCPFAWNDPFCHWCICNMPSLKSSPKFRLTSQTPIITQSYYWKKNHKKKIMLRKKSIKLSISDYFCNWAEQNGPHTACAWSVLFCDQFLPSHYHGHTTGCQRALPG